MQNRLSYFRKESGFSQQDLADMCGCNRRTVAAIEANENECSLALADRFCRALGCTLYDVFELSTSLDYNYRIKEARSDAVNETLERVQSYAGAFL